MKRILSKKIRTKLQDSRANTASVGRKVDRPKRAYLSRTMDASIRLNPDHRAIEYPDRLSSGPFIIPLVQGEIDLPGGYLGNLHCFTGFYSAN